MSMTWIREALRGRAPWMPETGGVIPCAVLVPLLVSENGVELLFARRTEDGTLHSGQVCFPGGKCSDGDLDARATALREAHEEIGLAPESVEVIGGLGSLRTMTGYAIAPVVGLVRAPYPFCLNPREIARLITLPLEDLLSPGRIVEDGHRMLDGRPTVSLYVGEDLIWGATARIALELAHVLRAARRGEGA